MLYYLVSGVIVVYQGFIACYCAPLKQIPVQLHELQIFTWLFTSTSLHFLVKNLGDLSCTYFCHQKMFTKDNLNSTSAYAHAIGYQQHTDSIQYF